MLGELEVNDENTIDEWRVGIMSFLLDHWAIVKAQLDCPAKSGDKMACFSCVDSTVMVCITENKPNESQIKNHADSEKEKLYQLRRK